MKTAECQINLEVMVDCPYCDNYQDVFDDVSQVELDMFDCASEGRSLDIEATCKECKKEFELKKIYY